MIKSTRAYFRGLTDQYGHRFTLTLVSIYGAIKGLMYQIILNASLPYFKRLGVTGPRYQSLTVVATTPWAMKSGLGLLSDTIPLYGYHRRSYLVLVSVLGTVALCGLGVMPLTPAVGVFAAGLLFLVNLQVSATDLLGEAKYAELMVSGGRGGVDVVSFVWGLYSIGCVFGSLISGPLADRYDPRVLFLVATPLALQVMFPAIAGWFPEQRKPHGKCRFRRDKLRAHPGLAVLSLAMMLGSFAIASVSAAASPHTQALTSVAVATFLIALGGYTLPPTLRRANLFLFLNNALYLSLSGALDFFYTAAPACVPGGPHFSFAWYVTWANLIGGLASLAGLALFQHVLQGRTFRMAFCAGTTVRIIASFVDIAITTRFNVSTLGIGDHTFFLLGDAIVTQLVAMLDLIPAVVLTSKVCPPGMEASVFALLVSFQNLGQGVASTLGVSLIDAAAIRTTPPCDFSNLPAALAVGHVLLPALAFPLIFLLIPDARLSDELRPPDDERRLHAEYMQRARMVEAEEEEAEQAQHAEDHQQDAYAYAHASTAHVPQSHHGSHDPYWQQGKLEEGHHAHQCQQQPTKDQSNGDCGSVGDDDNGIEELQAMEYYTCVNAVRPSKSIGEQGQAEGQGEDKTESDWLLSTR